ncbi:CPBP family intramembrane glutamic endopeptidase [Trujillonella humicola]|uniref:CPBP family intramembrane glutamic endopeptidase n=1 Tax=Trujillonella humicola TaxID=3383699 RepID=UPI003905B7C4
MTTLRPELSEAQARRLLVERTVLDEQARAAHERDPGSWGLRTWLGPLLVLAGVLVLGHLVARYDGPGGVALAVAVLIGGELLVLAALLAFGRPVAARAGGWRAAFGLDRVRRHDWLPWLVGFCVIYACRTAVVFVAAVLSDGRALEESSNLPTGDLTLLGIVVLVLAAVVLAPVTEELMFRGLLLRSFMRRMPFWPAALLSSLLFALFHVHQVQTLLGAVTLALSVGVLGVGACFVVRITGRLAPAMMIHATYNALALVIALATAA